MTPIIREPRSDAEWEAFAAVDSQAFGSTRAETDAWRARYRAHTVARIIVDGGRVAGGCLIHPVAQWAGGHSVPAGAVGGVCVLPEDRGRGFARTLLRAVVATCRDLGLPLIPLWPSATRLYRAGGWETTGRSRHRFVRTAALAELRGQGRLVRDPDPAAIDDLVRRCGRGWNGPIDPPGWWRTANCVSTSVPPELRFTYGWVEGDRTTGFVRFDQRPGAPPGQTLTVTEWWTETVDATGGLARFLGSHVSFMPEVAFAPWALPADDDLFRVLPDADRQIREEAWLPMATRIADVPAALERRGWPEGLTGRLDFAVTDPFSDRVERVVLETADGMGRVTPGGTGAVQLGIGALSAWYHGALRGGDGIRQGLITAGAADAEFMTALTGDRAPWLSAIF